jgi:hypothetical protein
MLKQNFLLRKVNNDIFKIIDIKTEIQSITIDFQDIEYYESRSTSCIRKLKSENKTPKTD